MEKYESKQVRITRPVEQIYQLVSRFDNLTPVVADKVEGWTATEDSCSFRAKGFTLSLNMVEKEPNKLVKIQSGEGSPLAFTFWIQLVSVAEDDTRMRLVLHVELNMMMKMMVGSKLSDAVNMMAERMAEAFNNAPVQ